MTVNTLHFWIQDRKLKGPVRLKLDSDGLGALLDAGPRPAVFVLPLADLRALLKHPLVRDRIRELKSQHPGKGLTTYFVGDEPVALPGKYRETGKLTRSVSDFLERGGERHGGVYFLGAAPEVFEELLKRKALPTPVESTDPEQWLARFSGDSPAAKRVRDLVRIAATAKELADRPVLLLGPSGTGKEIVARAIHELGRGARGGAWVAFNCAALSRDLLEAELFGIEPKVATNVDGRIGLLEQASKGGGTLFLNEIGELPLEQQAKLLRALEEEEIQRVGGRQVIPLNVRVIADTNRDLYGMVVRNDFREDLFYRLAHLVIRVPGLAERRGDIGLLAQRLWRDDVTRSPAASLSPEIVSLLEAHSWPGGVRELSGVLETLYLQFYGELKPRGDQLLEAWSSRPGAPLPGPQTAAVSRVGEVAGSPGAGHSVRAQVAAFKNVRPLYEHLAGALRQILERVAKQETPLAIVQARAKATPRFAEKILRKKGLSNPLEDLRDLCGARVIVHTEDQVRSVTSFLERYFEVDLEESTRATRSSTTTRSGFGAVRRVVRLDRPRAEALRNALGIEVPEEALGLWAEVEVRTVLEHAWLHLTLEMGHRVPVPPPDRWSQELADLAEVLKAVDRSFSQMRAGFHAHGISYPAYLSPEEIVHEIGILEQVLESGPDPDVATRLGKLAIELGDWDRAIEVLQVPAASGFQPALRDLGVALCQKDRKSPESALYHRGQQLLEQACTEPHRDPHALCSLVGTWKRRGDDRKALDLYRRAHEIDPLDSYSLGGVIESERALRPDVDSVTKWRPAIERAIERCREQIAAGVNLPWAFYARGKFLLLTGKREEGLLTLSEAIEHSTAPFMIQTSLESFDRLSAARDYSQSLEEGRALLARSLPSVGGEPQRGVFDE